MCGGCMHRQTRLSLAGALAVKMGLNVKLCVATNQNDILARYVAVTVAYGFCTAPRASELCFADGAAGSTPASYARFSRHR